MNLRGEDKVSSLARVTEPQGAPVAVADAPASDESPDSLWTSRRTSRRRPADRRAQRSAAAAVSGSTTFTQMPAPSSTDAGTVIRG